ncbi:MAG: peptidoglycan editing factor PgeF [Sneathiella sp.]|nr:peptidoglycan editing factor PgeF [Sneathiella sp.]
MITSNAFDSSIVSHQFFSKEGGVSSGLYGSLNCGAGSSDNPENVIENKKIAMRMLGVETHKLASLYQIHSADVITITSFEQLDEKPKADAMVTRLKGVALGILTADCVPILFADAKNKVIGAAHSGWKGTLGNISANVIESMISLGASRENITAVVGPAIQQSSYEVGPEFPVTFIKSNAAFKDFFRPSIKEDHHMFDLTGLVQLQLEREKIKSVDRIRRDTCAEKEQFFSYRRMSKNGEADYGRQLSAITLKS